MRTTFITAAGLALALATASPAAAATPETLTTSEQDCAEIGSFRFAANADAIDARLPDGWKVSRDARGRGRTYFVDYTCERWSIDGRPERRTSVSWLTAVALKGSSLRFWTLAIGSDNPHYVGRLRKLGLRARHLPESVVTLTSADGRVELEQRFVDAGEGPGLTYTRRTTAPEPDPATRRQEAGGTFWAELPSGEVLRWTYRNDAMAPVQATMTESYEEGSLPTTFGIAPILTPVTSPSLSFLRGSWEGSIARLPG